MEGVFETEPRAGAEPYRKQHYLWRSVDQDGEVVDVLLQAQRFVTTHAAVHNLFNLGRHLVRAQHYTNLKVSAFTELGKAVV